jgi:hypothetical protein
MKLLGQPFSIQNTAEHGWLVTWTDAVVHRVDGEPVEAISFTVAVPRNVNLSMSDVQTYALKRAVELLQVAIKHREAGGQ